MANPAFNNRTILAIDPGPTESAWVIYDPAENRVIDCGHECNDDMAEMLRPPGVTCRDLCIEMIACYGMAVGKDVFETCLWIGRYMECWRDVGEANLVYRRDVKLTLCNSARAKDANVRQALLDRFPRTGGGATPQVGTKSKPGPLFGVSKHIWAALGVAVTWAEIKALESRQELAASEAA